jgi:hypothetical protein
MRNKDKTFMVQYGRTIRRWALLSLILFTVIGSLSLSRIAVLDLRKSEADLEAQLRDARVTNGELVLHANVERRLKKAEEDLALEIESCNEDSVDLERGYLETVNVIERQLVSCNGENHKASARIGLCRWRLRLTEQDVITLRREDDAEIYGEKNLATDEWLNGYERMRLNEH